jgi:hypothetical protein
MATYKERTTDDEFDKDEFQHIIDEGHDSDFLLEMAAARCLRAAGFGVQHSRYYTDPVTGKTRQYDLRALKGGVHGNLQFYLSLECKNIGKNFPLLVSATPRESGESSITYLKGFGGDMHVGITAHDINCPLYLSTHVGRAVTQFERKGNGKSGYKYSTGNDRVGEKWTQVISQLQAMAEEDITNIVDLRRPTFLIPILVVNDDTLWKVGYGFESEVAHYPELVQKTDWIISKGFSIKYQNSTAKFNISHLHITTISGLPDLLNEILLTRT